MSPNRSEWLSQATLRLQQSGNTASPRLDAELILAHTLKTERIHLHAHPEIELNPREISTLDGLLAKRATGYPIAYITGYKEFFGYQIAVSEHTLVPRPETEELVLAAINAATTMPTSVVRTIDVGCGSGAIGLSLALELTKLKRPYEITLADISAEALKTCQKNQLSLEALNTKIIQNNLLSGHSEHYDVIVANLPYVSPEWKVGLETKFEPQGALFAKDGGLELINKLIKQIAKQRNLQTGGWLILESDPRQQKAIARQLRISSFGNVAHNGHTTTAQYTK